MHLGRSNQLLLHTWIHNRRQDFPHFWTSGYRSSDSRHARQVRVVGGRVSGHCVGPVRVLHGVEECGGGQGK